MALKALLKNLDGLSDEVKSQYKQVGDDFILDVDDKEYKAKLGEFRDNNRTLHQTKQDLEAKLEKLKGVDLEEYEKGRALISKLDEDEEGQLIKAGKIDVVINKRTDKMRNEHQTTVQTLQKQLDVMKGVNQTVTQRYHQRLLRESVAGIVDQVGVLRSPKALDDIVNRAVGNFKIDENERVVPIKDDYFNKEGQAMTLKDWATELVTDAPYFFEASSGGGAQGGSRTKAQTAGVKTLPNDPRSFSSMNLDDIISGKKVIDMSQS